MVLLEMKERVNCGKYLHFCVCGVKCANGWKAAHMGFCKRVFVI